MASVVFLPKITVLVSVSAPDETRDGRVRLVVGCRADP